MDELNMKSQILASIDDSLVPNLCESIKLKHQNGERAIVENKKPFYKKKLFWGVSTPLLAGACACAIILPITLNKNPEDNSSLTAVQKYVRMSNEEETTFSMINAVKMYETFNRPAEENKNNRLIKKSIYYSSLITPVMDLLNPSLRSIEVLLSNDYSFINESNLGDGNCSFHDKALFYNVQDFGDGKKYAFGAELSNGLVSFDVNIAKETLTEVDGYKFDFAVTFSETEFFTAHEDFTYTDDIITSTWVYKYVKDSLVFDLSITHYITELQNYISLVGKSSSYDYTAKAEIRLINPQLMEIHLTSYPDTIINVVISEDSYDYSSEDFDETYRGERN